MTVPTPDNKIQYTGAGTTDPLSVPFYFLQNSDLQVIQLDPDGIQTTLAENTDYTVDGAGDLAGGTVTPINTFQTDYLWTILRVVPLTQETDLQPNDPLPAETLERSLDKLTMGLQQLAEAGNRAATVPVSSDASGELPFPQSNRVLAWNDDATGLKNRDIVSGEIMLPLSIAEGGTGAETVAEARENLQIYESFIAALTADTTPPSAGAGIFKFRIPYAFILTEVRASLVTAQATGSIITVDINESGSSILSTKLTIDNTEKTSTTAAIPPVISDANLADDAEITIDIDQVGDGTARGLKVALIGRRA